MAGQVATSVSLRLVYRNEMEDDFLEFSCLRASDKTRNRQACRDDYVHNVLLKPKQGEEEAIQESEDLDHGH